MKSIRILTSSRSYFIQRVCFLTLAGFRPIAGTGRVIDVPNGRRYYSITMRLVGRGYADASFARVGAGMRRAAIAHFAARRSRRVA